MDGSNISEVIATLRGTWPKAGCVCIASTPAGYRIVQMTGGGWFPWPGLFETIDGAVKEYRAQC